MNRLVLLSAACHQVTFIIVESWLFKGLRDALARRNEHLGRLVSCHLCTGTWVALGMAALFRPMAVPPAALRGRARGVAAYAADSLIIAFGGRVLNEVIAVVRREVEIRERAARLLELRAREAQRSGEQEAQRIR